MVANTYNLFLNIVHKPFAHEKGESAMNARAREDISKSSSRTRHFSKQCLDLGESDDYNIL